MQRGKLRHAVNDKPSWALCLALALTHVLVIFDGIIFIPNLLGKSLNVDRDTLVFVTFGTVLVSAVFTFLQSRRTFGIGAGYILFVGSYSAFLACSMDAVRMGGFALLGTMTLLSVPVLFLYTYFIRFFRHIITPAVGGVVILLISVSMVPIGLEVWSGGGAMSPDETVIRLGVGLATALPLTLCMLFGNPLLKVWSPLIALTCGYVAASATGMLHLEHTLGAPWFGLPPMAWPGLEMNVGSEHLPLLFAFCMAMLVSMVENTGNIMLVQQLSQRDFRRVSYDEVQGGLYCDGLSKVASGCLGVTVPSIYCDNLPVVEITGIASRRIGAIGGAVLLVLAFMPKVSGFILDMPGPVIGGFLVVIVALLFHAGIGLVTMTRLSNQHGIILGMSFTVGLVAESGTFFPGVVPEFLSPMLQNSVAVGGFTAFFLSAVANLMPRKMITGTFAASPDRLPEVQAMLEAGRDRLGLDQKDFNIMSLCCEEVFMHMAGDGAKHGNGDRKLTFRISRDEEGYFAEAICGHMMDDINNFAVPESLFSAKPDELRQLGMILFSKYADDVKHLEISGYSYISFLLR